MARLLDRIDQPQDLQKLSVSDLTRLAAEIRQEIIQVVSRNGGHLAPNLGVVELTLCLHRVFNSPVDKIVWDVGHQAYVHKLLTGRRRQFSSLRQYGGISGFPKRSESEHDAFGTGHSSTSISAALGMAVARDMAGKKYHVVAVIGDGSLTGGEAFEALNDAGHRQTDLVVILNDNEMSIAKNVGALAKYLTRLRTMPVYSRVKQDVEFLLRRIPAIGHSVATTAERLKDSIKYLLVPGALFEELGFTYIGPIDGHNIPLLLDVLGKTKIMHGPLLVHVITRKGRGYGPAERNADIYHGVGPFCIETGKIEKDAAAPPTYTAVFGQTMVELAEQNPALVAITAAMPEGTGLKSFAARFPQRFFDVGIAEQHAVTMAAGMATQGLRPVVAIYSTFLQRAFDQIVHDVCLQNLPVIFAVDRAGIVGEDGATHQGVFDLSYLRQIPNLTLTAPKDENELRHLLYTALHYDGPMVIRYPRGSGVGADIGEPLRILPIGQGEILIQGRDVAILAIGAMVHPALAAAGILQQHGVAATVVNARYVQPMDEELIRQLARDIGVLVTVEDNVLAGGFGSAVLEVLCTRQLYRTRVLRLGLPHRFIEHGPRSVLLTQAGLDEVGIAKAVLAFLRQFGVK